MTAAASFASKPILAKAAFTLFFMPHCDSPNHCFSHPHLLLVCVYRKFLLDEQHIKWHWVGL